MAIPPRTYKESGTADDRKHSALSPRANGIAHQEEHHRLKPSREELVEFLEKAGIAYDPRYFD